MEWLPELTTWIQRNAGRPVAPAVFQKFVQLAGDKEMKAVYPGLSAGGQKNLLSMLSSRPYADGVGVAMLAVGNPGTRDVGLRLLLRPEAARHPEALKVVLSMQDKSMIRLDWSTRARWSPSPPTATPARR